MFILAGICGIITLIGMCVICVVECALEPLIRPMKATVMRNANDVLYRAKEADQLHVQELIKRKKAEMEVKEIEDKELEKNSPRNG